MCFKIILYHIISPKLSDDVYIRHLTNKIFTYTIYKIYNISCIYVFVLFYRSTFNREQRC